MVEKSLSICVVGGTGAEGSGLALRWAKAGHQVSIGSRDVSKAQSVAAELNAVLQKDMIVGVDSKDGSSRAEVVVLTVPFKAQLSTVELLRNELAGKILIDVTVPLVPPKVSQVQLPDQGSCVVAVQQKLGSQTRVVSAFQNVSAHKLKDLKTEIDCDVLVAADDPEARAIGMSLARDAGLRGIDVGPLANSVVAETMTSVLIGINRKYKVPDAGIRITGLGAAQQNQ